MEICKVNRFKVQINAWHHIFNLSIGKFGLANWRFRVGKLKTHTQTKNTIWIMAGTTGGFFEGYNGSLL
jgi:hypothetical protein